MNETKKKHILMDWDEAQLIVSCIFMTISIIIVGAALEQ